MSHNAQLLVEEMHAQQEHDWCDGCGERLTEPPIVRQRKDGRTLLFDRFECYHKVMDTQSATD